MNENFKLHKLLQWVTENSNFKNQIEEELLIAKIQSLLSEKNEINNSELEEVHGSSSCQYSVLENQLAKLSRNQIKIFDAINASH